MKLTLSPGTATAADIKRLRETGWSDEQLTIAVQVIGYFNYINRIAEGLGVDLEPWMTQPRDEWILGKANYQ